MRAVVQRVSSALVTVDGATVGEIGPGLLVLVGVAIGDTEADADGLAAKLVGLRVFSDDQGRMNRSVLDIDGSVLVVSQFTLLADTSRGRRPSFAGAADPARAEPLVERVVDRLAEAGVVTATGRFGARMEVSLVNDGPVTLILESGAGRVS